VKHVLQVVRNGCLLHDELKAAARASLATVYGIPGNLTRQQMRTRVLWLLEKLNFTYSTINFEVSCSSIDVAILTTAI